MAPVVPLDVLQTRFLDRMAEQLCAAPATWPGGVQASAQRVSAAMAMRQVPDAEDLCRVLFTLLDADGVAGYLADRRLSTTSVASGASKPSARPSGVFPREEALHFRLGLPSAPVGVFESVEGQIVYFPPF